MKICEHGFSHVGNHTCDDCCVIEELNNPANVDTIRNAYIEQNKDNPHAEHDFNLWLVAERKRVAEYAVKKFQQKTKNYTD